MTYKDQWLSAAQVLRAQAIKFEEIAKSAPERPDIDPTEPDKFFFITQLREAVGLPVGALPISPKQAWEEAIAKVKAAPCEHPPGAREWKFDGAFQCVECGALFDGLGAAE